MRGRLAALLVGVAGVVGCASPGPPRPPTLQLPDPVRDLSAQREGDAVALRFTLPQRTTDNLPIREATIRVSVCRAEGEGAPCLPVRALQDVGFAVTPGANAAARTEPLREELPAEETAGPPRLLLYRVELKNLEGRTAGWSEPAYAAAGAAPQDVSGLRAEETRAGILLRWVGYGAAEGEDVLLRRELVAPPKGGKRGEAEPVWMDSHARADETLDATAAEDVAYRYVAVRRRVVELGGRKVELRSGVSAPVEITWRNAFPPAAPAGLSAAPFAEGGQFAVDLVWEPVLEPGLRGYVLTRQDLDGGAAERLTPEPVALPAFHDATAKPGVKYRYGVRAVSKKGVLGDEATVLVGP